MTKKCYDFVCSTCGSNDVLSDAYAEWNIVTQQWELQNTFDKGAFCAHCDGETRFDRVELSKEDAEARIAKHCEDDEPNR